MRLATSTCWRVLAVAVVWFSMAWPSSSYAQATASAARSEADELRPIVDRLAGNLAQADAIPGLIVGVSRHGKRSYFSYSATSQPAYDANTIVEIGSITKVFTTTLFAEAVSEGRVACDATLQSLLPDAQLQTRTGKITLLELADFSSGMPTLPDDVSRRLARRGIDDYTNQDFMRWLSTWQSTDAAGCQLLAPYHYSNASVGLLGVLLS